MVRQGSVDAKRRTSSLASKLEVPLHNAEVANLAPAARNRPSITAAVTQGAAGVANTCESSMTAVTAAVAASATTSICDIIVGRSPQVFCSRAASFGGELG